MTEPIVVAALPVPPAAADLAGLERDTIRLTAQERGWPRRRVTSERGRLLVLALPLNQVLLPGTVLHVGEGWYVVLEPAAEPVLAVTPRTSSDAIRVALEVGNLHAVLAVDGDLLLVPDEPAMERLLRRLDVPWTRTHSPFRPISVGTPHA
jgi:urease accessory protein UreE